MADVRVTYEMLKDATVVKLAMDNPSEEELVRRIEENIRRHLDEMFLMDFYGAYFEPPSPTNFPLAQPPPALFTILTDRA